MAAKHYVKPRGKKPYLKKKEWIALGAILSAIVVGAGIFFILQAALDKSLPIENGRAVTDVEHPIIVNEGTAERPKYYVYATYDFSTLDAGVSVELAREGGSETGIYIYPRVETYAYAYLYGQNSDAGEAAERVQANIGALLPNGDVRDLVPFEAGGRKGSAYWYTFWSEKRDESGEPMVDADENPLNEYQQTFSCYLPTSRGCLIARVTYKGADESAFVDEAAGFAALKEVVDCVQMN